MTNPLNSQVGGDHYKRHPIQPIEFAHANHFPPCLAGALKYIVRYGDKGNPIEDLQKAIHYCNLQMELNSKVYWNWGGLWGKLSPWPITPSEFCGVNKLSISQKFVISKLCYYRDEGGPALLDAIAEIERMITYYKQ